MIKDLMEWPGRCPQGEIFMYIWYWSVVYIQMIDKVVKVGWCDFLCSFILICIFLCICLYKRADCNGGKGNCLLPCGIFIVFFFGICTPQGSGLNGADYTMTMIIIECCKCYPWVILGRSWTRLQSFNRSSRKKEGSSQNNMQCIESVLKYFLEKCDRIWFLPKSTLRGSRKVSLFLLQKICFQFRPRLLVLMPCHAISCLLWKVTFWKRSNLLKSKESPNQISGGIF